MRYYSEGDLENGLYNMKIGNKICTDNNSSWLRVPHGWIYTNLQGPVFVPYKHRERKYDGSR